MDRLWIAVASVSGAVAVAADAVARHLLAGDPAHADLVATGARYGLVHAVALLAAALMLRGVAGGAARFFLAVCGWCFVAALVLFSGVLYLLGAGLPAALTPLVPVGGTLFIVGWAALFVAAVTARFAR